MTDYYLADKSRLDGPPKKLLGITNSISPLSLNAVLLLGQNGHQS